MSKKGLALDGGGVLGVGQAAIMASAPDALSKFDFVAGTSVGAILAGLLASGTNATDYLKFFRTEAPRIFAGYCWRRYSPFTPRYNDKVLNSVLRAALPGRFGELKVPTFITCADLNNQRPKVFSSLDADDGQWLLWEVVRAAVAAETYFLPWKGLADGAIFANNPSMVAVAGAVNAFKIPLSELSLFSIGTGEAVTNNNVGSTRGWTHFRWGIYIIGSMLRGAANTMHEYFVRQLPLAAYDRIQFERDPEWTIDNPAVMDPALDRWKNDIAEGARRLKIF